MGKYIWYLPGMGFILSKFPYLGYPLRYSLGKYGWYLPMG